MPGEYCPGAHSVNARGVVKLVGTGQRVVRNAWLFSTLIVLGDDDVLRDLLTDIYRLLELPFDPVSVGSLSSETDGLDFAALERRVIAAYAPTEPAALDAATLALARSLVADHVAD